MNSALPLHFRGLVVRSALCVATLLLAAASPAQTRYSFETTRTVLPKTAVPTRYLLTLDVDPARDRFDGRAEIDVRIAQPLPEIVLHADRLDARSATLVQGGATRALEVRPDARRHTWRLLPRDGRPVPAGDARLDIAYRGHVNATGEGLYRARYQSGGRSGSMLATQLQAVKARSVFPAFDEPVFRAVFELRVRAPRGLQVLSNTPQTQALAMGSRVEHRFAPTPPMPSYLVALSVGRFDVLEGRSGEIPLRIFTVPGKREQARYAMEVAQQVLPWYAEYFGTPYALPKLDQLAVPNTRDGAMEDWGLISYVESILLYDPARSSPQTQRWVFGVAAHEIAHQWFGNLVSVSSWDETWLNEAFATWMQNKAADRFHPEWQVQLSQREGVDRALERDATAATRAIRSGPVDEARVFEAFDGITYNKGGAVLSMIEQWVGEDAFQRGLAAYMRERRLAPAAAGDLWRHIGQGAGRPVEAMAASWTDQPGYPLVDVDLACEGDRSRVTLRQQRFRLDQADAPAGGPVWQVPVRISRGTQVDTVMLDGPTASVDLAGCSAATLLANAGGRGFYRVRHAEPLRQRLIEGFGALSAADRVALLADSHALAQAGGQPLARHFDWLAQLPRVKDTGRAPLYAQAATQLEQWAGALAGLPAAASLRSAAASLLSPELARLGWTPASGEDAEVTRLRATLIETLARFDDAEVVAAAHVRFPAAMAARGSAASKGLHPSLRAAVIDAIGRHASAEEFEALMRALRATDSQEERWVLLAALAGTREPTRVQRVLDLTLAPWLPRDLVAELPGLVARRSGQPALAYDFVLRHWPRLSRSVGGGIFAPRAWLLPSASDGLSDRADAQRLRSDQQRLLGDTGRSTAERMASRIELRAAARDREAGRLPAALDAWRPVAVAGP